MTTKIDRDIINFIDDIDDQARNQRGYSIETLRYLFLDNAKYKFYDRYIPSNLITTMINEWIRFIDDNPSFDSLNVYVDQYNGIYFYDNATEDNFDMDDLESIYMLLKHILRGNESITIYSLTGLDFTITVNTSLLDIEEHVMKIYDEVYKNDWEIPDNVLDTINKYVI